MLHEASYHELQVCATGHTLQLPDEVVSPQVQLRVPDTIASEVSTTPAMRPHILGQLASDVAQYLSFLLSGQASRVRLL